VRQRLRQIATAGNAAAVALLVVAISLLASIPAPPEPLPLERTRSNPTLLIVIDALRRDLSEDPALMPNLNRLAAEGGRGTARVESWIPSTVAGIRSITEGAVPPPASFLQDFGASRSPDGGIFATAKRAGLRTFAAGPRLWTDLYGPWLDGSLPVAVLGGDDGRVLQAGLDALGRHDLVVVHLSGPDDAAHLHGGDSPQYRAALRQADSALGRLIGRAGPETAVVVTSDHGVTDRGGHAGPEPEVLETPVVVRGPGLPRGHIGEIGNIGEVRQRDLGRLILTGRAESPPHLPAPSRNGTGLLASIFALVCISILGSRLASGAEGGRAAFALNASLWAGLALALFGFPRTSLLLAGVALAAAPLLLETRTRTQAHAAILATAAAGLGFGFLRLLDGGLPPWALLPSGAPGRLALCAIGLAAGFALRRTFSLHPLAAGVLSAFLPALLLRLLGETASLSTLDVRLAFRVATGPLGLPGAVITVLLIQALPVLILLGLGPALARAQPDRIGRFAAGLAVALTAQGACAVTGPLALGLLVRLVGETTFWFLGSAAAVALGRLREWERAARARSPAASRP
jgi:hypothetical protein